MPDAQDHAASSPDSSHVEPLLRAGAWGLGAATALFLAILAGLSGPGARRLDSAVALLSGSAKAPAVKPQTPTVAAETRRLSQQVRRLAADRDRLMARLSRIEHDLSDVTGSIKKQEKASAPPIWSASAARALTFEPIATTAAAPPAEPVQAITAESPVPEARPPADAHAGPEADEDAAPLVEARAAAKDRPARPAYAVDLGGGGSLDRIRLLWDALRSAEPKLLQGLHPLAQSQTVENAARPEIRLIVGPFTSAEDAKKLCAALLDDGRYCAPAIFRGRPLSGH